MLKRLFSQFAQSTASIRIVRSAVVAIWVLVLVTLAPACAPEIPGRAQSPAPGAGVPEIVLEPSVGSVGTTVTVRGEGWNDGSMVLIYLVAPGETEPPNYAVAGATVDAEGRFTVEFVVPLAPGWERQGLAIVIARDQESDATARAVFSTVSLESEAMDTPKAQPETATPTATTQPGTPTATATTDLNIRGGPGTDYPVLGLLRAGQSAEITGVSPERGWWQIKFSGAADERGWVSARYVSAENTGDTPVAHSPSLPPVAISDWRGEYYNNRNLSGAPILVRNDAAVNFDWGTGAPAAGMSADDFSVRWSRAVSFSGGTYRFYAQADDGVRVWVDGALVIDQWHDSAPTTYSADVYLTDGTRSLKMEYYEHTGNALAQLAWERLETYPDWKGEYFNNPDLSGAPVLVRNDVGIGFDWGPNSPGPGVPADNFSARWSRSLHFKAGTYRFKAVVDDGARLWVDEGLIIDRWQAGDPKGYTAEVTLTEGTHNLRLEYLEFRYDAQVHLTWERVDGYPDWKGEYYDNRKLDGSPILVRNDSSINFNWETGSPGPGVPVDNFSVRWTRAMDFKSGTYVFSVWVDDGVRLWIDDKLVIDDWQDSSARQLQAEWGISGGAHRVKVEYYERGGAAQIAVNWSRKQEPANQPPQAVPGGPYIADEGSSIALDGSGSKDPDGSIVRFEWDFNYDGRTFIVGALGEKTSMRYADGPATLTIALRVTDDKGANQIATAQVKVDNVAPTVEAGGPYTGRANSPISMAGTATDPGSIDQAGLVYTWDFGDGTQGSGPIVGHSYATPGDYVVKLTVTDKDGTQGSDTATVQVIAVDQPPTAVISGPTQRLVGEPLIFSGSGSSDSDGTIVSYAWLFGDGTSGDEVNVTHSYGAPGSYQVRLTVTDNTRITAQATHTVQVNEPAPVNQPPTAVISGSATAAVGQTVQFDGSESSDSDGGIVSYAWDFGDGGTGSGITVTHVYTGAGTYQVVLMVTDDGGLTANATHSVRIEPEPTVTSQINLSQ
jgi:PKD repeat protein/uncharacterized protein YraI